MDLRRRFDRGMWSDVLDLRDFYDSSLGQTARRVIRRQLRLMWPDTHGLRVLGLGYATPYLRSFREDTERVLAIAPSSQGVMPWPPEGPGLIALADETDLPLPDRSIDRVLLIHTLESTEHVRLMMREIWRVLTDGGRLMVVTPNRRGIWARLERTPFGQGRPYSPGQLNRMLRDNMFAPLQSETALFMPPFRRRVILRSAFAWEEIGHRLFKTFAGVLMVEAAKQIYAGSPLVTAKASARGYLSLPQGFQRSGKT